jgi:hypothetical protein
MAKSIEIPKRWTNVSEADVERIKILWARNWSVQRIASEVRKNYKTTKNVIDLIENRAVEDRVYDLVSKIMNNDWTETKRIAAETIVRLVKEGNPTMCKWIMEKSDNLNKASGVTGDVFGTGDNGDNGIKGESDNGNQ